MARNKGTFAAPFNFQVKMQEAFDPRTSVSTKADLINKETWPYDGDTIYLYKGLLVSVADEQSVYMLVDMTKITASDYSGWVRVDAGNAKQIEIVDNLTSDATDKALSAKQGKALMTEITGVKNKLTNIYTYKGSKTTYASLPTDAVAGDVWNVEEAYDGHPAGTNYAWTGTDWDALAGSIDLSNYFDKSEVNAAIKVETDRADAEEKRLAGLIAGNTALANEAKGLAQENKTQLEGVTKSIGEINTSLNAVIETNTTQDSRLKALEDLVTGEGDGEGGEEDQTLLQKVNANTLAISTLQTTVGDTNSGLVKAVNTLNGDKNTVGSVDYKIDQAFKWVEV